MNELLFLAHRLPFPPNKGDKIRSYNMVRELARHFRIHVGAFVDDQHDWDHVDAFAAQVHGLHVENLNPRLARVRSALGMLTGEPLSLPFYRSSSMQRWVDHVVAESDIRHVVCYCSVMAQYVMHHVSLSRYMDFVDMDSDKWRQYARHKPIPLSWIYAREGRSLLRVEAAIARAFDYSWFVSESEVRSFHDATELASDKAGWIDNGVDLEYFSPRDDRVSPYAPDAVVCVFTGAMDYFANVDAVAWFCEKVWPLIRVHNPAAQFFIVGSNPTARVHALAEHPGVHVTGRVPDVRPYLQHAHCAVAPLRIARGVQNKVLEAMAMCTPAVCSPQAAVGLKHDALLASLTADSAERFASICLRLLDRHEVFPACRAYVETNYQWSRNLQPLVARLQACGLQSHEGPTA